MSWPPKVRGGGFCWTSTAPGCNNPIQELDHVIPYPKGPTAVTNIDGDCEHHHRLKHDNYTVTRNTDGSRTWTTPLGRRYTTVPHEY